VPTELATGRCMAAMTIVGGPSAPAALPYWATAPGPPVISSVLPATAPSALRSNRTVTVTLGWIMTLCRAPTPDGSWAGAVSGSAVCARAWASDGTEDARPAEAQLTSANGNRRAPVGGSPVGHAGARDAGDAGDGVHVVRADPDGRHLGRGVDGGEGGGGADADD